MSKKMYCNHY